MVRSVEQLFVRFRAAGDVSALAEVFERTAPELLKVGLHLARDPAAAEDLLHATFVVAMETAETFDADRPLVPWLLGILTNQARKMRWRDGRVVDPQRVRVTPPRDPGQDAEDRELSAALTEAVDRLHEPYRQLMVLHLRHGLAPVEIADVLGRSPGTVRSQLARALELLRHCLPVGFTAAALGLLPARGLACVKRAILQHASTLVAPSLGAFAMKKILVTTVGLLLMVLLGAIAIPQLWNSGILAEPGPPEVLSAETPQPVAPRQAEDALAARRDAGLRGRVARSAAQQAEDFGSVLVRLVWEDTGAPAAGVPAYVVTWARSDRPLYREYRLSDPNGVVQYAEVYRGPISVYTLVGGHARAEVRAGQRTAVEVPVPRGLEVAGVVVDTEGRPVPDAEVWLCAAGAEFRGVRAVQADAWGEFRMHGLQADNLLGARRAGFAPSDLQEVGGLPEDGTPRRRRAKLVLSGPGSGVTGRVVDGFGAPVAGARVQIHPLRGQDEWGRIPMQAGAPLPLRIATGADGTFATADLPSGDVVVSARVPGRVPARVEASLEPGQVTEVVLVLEEGVTVLGRVTDRSGQPIADAHVESGDYGYFSHYSATTDARGDYRLEGLPPHPEVQAFTGAGRHVVAKLTGVAGETVRWDPVLTGGNEIRGRLLDAAGQPLGGWSVWVRGARGQSGTVETDAQGGFAFSNRLDEEHTLEVRAGGEQFTLPPLLTVNGLRCDGEVLELRVPDASLRLGALVGRVLDEADRPVHAVITCTYGDGESITLREESSPDTGLFAFHRMPPMEYRLAVEAIDHPPSHTAVTVFPGREADAGVLRLQAGGRLALHLERRDGRPPQVTGCRLVGPAGAISLEQSGDVWSAMLTAGSYRLVIEGEDFLRHVQQLQLDGADREERIELVAAHRQVFGFELPDAADFPYRLHLLLQDGRGETVREESLIGDPTQPYRWAVGLAPGDYRLQVSTSTGASGEAAFRIPATGGEAPPITVRLE